MGTNYYTKVKKCKECGHKPTPIHLGKSSGGWTFSFQYNYGKYYKNIEEMKIWLRDKSIEDEYGNDINREEFWNMVERKQEEEKLNHSIEYPTSYNYLIDGYSFSDGEFS
jgi:hypothetical protein